MTPTALAMNALQAAVLGFLLPPIIAIIQQPQWPNWLRTLVSVLCCLLAGTYLAFEQGAFAGGLDKAHLGGAIIVVLGATQTFYGQVWKNLGAQTIEQATTSILAWLRKPPTNPPSATDNTLHQP